MEVLVHPQKPAGALRLPPSKSMAHRLLVCAALAEGHSRVEHLDDSEDMKATCRALRALGADIQWRAGRADIRGLGPDVQGWRVHDTAIDCAESGSTLRFMIPLFVLGGQPATFTGAKRLYERPLSVYQAIFEKQGLLFRPQPDGLQLCGPLAAGEFSLPGNVSSQFISGLLFALPLLAEESILRISPPFESRDYVEMTRRAQALFGVHSRWLEEGVLQVPGGQRYQAAQVAVEGDWSQAGVPAVMGAVQGPLRLQGLDAQSAQGDKAILEMVASCGAQVSRQGDDFVVQPPPDGLKSPGEIDLAACPDLGPMLCVLALCCKGTTRIVNAGRLRIKESDRIASMERELRKLAADISSTEDCIVIQGGRPLHSGETQGHNDHRVVMALCAAAVCGQVPVTIQGAEAVRKSWPRFFEDMKEIGVQWEEK